MRTLQEKYNGIQEGKFSKENFLADARRELPNLVTRFNGYDDAVQILKNRGMIQEVRVEEARLTKNNLTDYRYKPTNEMDKYPYEQILRGLRVELEAMGIPGTPTAEEYAKALAKVSKNLAKDSIFYTNQLAGVNPKVDQHDQMVDATAKNTVDTFNGMKKAELKEGFKKLIKKVLSEEVIDVESYKEDEVYEMYGEDVEEVATNITGFPKWRELDPEEKERIGNFVKDTGDRDQADYERARKERLATQSARLAKHIEGGIDESAMGDIYQIAQEYDRFEDFVQAVEDEFGPVEDIAELEHIFNSTRGEDDIDYGDENFSDAEIDTEYESPSDRMYNSDAWVQAQRDMMEGLDTEADKNMVRKLMYMYEAEPAKFERLHKQAKVQASTTQDIKHKHLLSLIDRAKAGAGDYWKNSGQGMDEEFTMDKFKKGLKNFGRTAKQVGSALIGEPTYDHIDSKTGEWKKDRAGKDYDMYSYADVQGADLEPEEDLNEVRKAKSLSELLK